MEVKLFAPTRGLAERYGQQFSQDWIVEPKVRTTYARTIPRQYISDFGGFDAYAVYDFIGFKANLRGIGFHRRN